MIKGLVERAISDYIESVTEEREPDEYIHPSSASLCQRRTVYAARADGLHEELDQPTKRKFYIGHRIHEIVQRSLEASGEISTFYAEVEVFNPDLNVKGAADAVILVGDKYYLVEVKSISKGSLRYGGMPKEHHTTQARMYAHTITEHGFAYDFAGDKFHVLPLGIEGIIYVYLEKETLQVYEYYQRYTKTQHKEITKLLEETNEYIKDGIALPPRLALTGSGKKPWPCNYCPFAERCWKVDPYEIEIGAF